MCVDSKNQVVARQTDPKEQSHETKCDITPVMCGGADLSQDGGLVPKAVFLK